MKAVHVLLAFLLGAQIGNTAAAELEVLGSEFHGTTTTSIVYADLQRQAYEALARRREAYEKLKTPDEIQAYQQRVREFFVGQLGGFPERTPLNAKVVGALQADGYRIEKIIFESQPNHRVTALLYLPDAKPPYPGVAVACGHSRTAKTADYNQRFAVAMALHGMAALCYDPIGQGERSQILTPEGKPRFNSTTQEHSIIGVGSILLGTNTARYRVWDGMRAIDYLASRPEINSKRIGVTGCSGGGTLSSYLMALDDRVLCAAPSCYLTTFQRLIETIGPQDAEQNIAGQVAFGMDHPDYILMRAPRPTLIGSTTGDYFDIQGAWDNFRQAKRLYWRLGFPERVDLVEGEGGHGVPPGNLVAITRWMRRWLLEKDDAVTLPEIPARTEAELLCLPEGQVLRLPNERSVFDLNIEWEKKLAEQRRELWARTPRAEAVRQVRDVLGVRRLDDLPRPKIEKMGTVQRENYSIEKLAIVPEGGVALPALAFVPAKPDNNAYLYLHGSGKQADAAPGGPIEKLVGQRHIVLAVDLRAIGETKAARVKEQQDDSKTYNLAYLLGKSFVGIRCEEALICARFLADYKTSGKARRVHLIGIGTAGVPALHAAALEPALFASLTLRQTLVSWSNVVHTGVTQGQVMNTVHGALRVYDLPDLVRSLRKIKVTVEEPLDAAGNPASQESFRVRGLEFNL